jgi:transcriptional regulator with XRE-family HTH domain
MSSGLKKSLNQRIKRGRAARNQFVESHLSKTIANQIRATRDKLNWSQEDLAREASMNQNAISRLESVAYGKPTLTTLKRIAAALDVALIVRLVPFSELVDWVCGTPRVNTGLSLGSLAVPSFEMEDKAGVFDEVEELTLSAAAINEASEEHRQGRIVIDEFPASGQPNAYGLAPTLEYDQKLEPFAVRALGATALQAPCGGDAKKMPSIGLWNEQGNNPPSSMACAQAPR